MSLYPLLREALFLLDAETAHLLALRCLRYLEKIRVAKALFKPRVSDPITLMGLTFPNRVGLAAGYDRNGEFISALASLGFGFLEVGTVTPDSWPGKPRPRVFRLPKHRAIINRYGFANNGLTNMICQLRARQFDGILGVNIVKNVETKNENAAADYCLLMSELYPYVDYIAVNISSPNTEGLRELQGVQYLVQLLSTLKDQQATLENTHSKKVPLIVKVAPDLNSEEILQMCEAFLHCQIDGIISGNTTLSRTTVTDDPLSNEQGGMSGAPLFSLATNTLSQFKKCLGEKIPIIGCGGILSGEDAQKKIQAGASLVQLYTGLVYRGPTLVHEVATALSKIKK